MASFVVDGGCPPGPATASPGSNRAAGGRDALLDAALRQCRRRLTTTACGAIGAIPNRDRVKAFRRRRYEQRRCHRAIARPLQGRHGGFARSHADILRRETLIATRTTGALLEREVGLEVECVLFGPEGGDLQIGAQIAEGNIGAVIFLRDVLTSQPHEPDITALLRVDVHNVPVATNLATAGTGSSRSVDAGARSGKRRWPLLDERANAFHEIVFRGTVRKLRVRRSVAR